MSASTEDDGINVTIRTYATVVPSYNVVVQLTDEQARAVDVELMVVAVGRVIREQRLAAGVTLSEFARRAGVVKGRISQIERAKGHKGMTMASLVMVARALGVPASRVLELAEEYVHGRTT
jgi:plasmid maintenance system antidote protein VapI